MTPEFDSPPLVIVIEGEARGFVPLAEHERLRAEYAQLLKYVKVGMHALEVAVYGKASEIQETSR